jgi:hypothetical protein
LQFLKSFCAAISAVDECLTPGLSVWPGAFLHPFPAADREQLPYQVRELFAKPPGFFRTQN